MDQNQSAIVQALIVANPNDPHIRKLVKGVLAGDPVTEADFKDALIHSSLGHDAIASIVMAHDMLNQDMGGTSNITELLMQGEDYNYPSGGWDQLTKSDDRAYRQALEIAFENSNMDTERARSIYKALQFVLGRDRMTLQEAINEARKQEPVPNEGVSYQDRMTQQ